MGARPVVVARELTKLHEEFLRGTAAEIRAELAARPAVKGEITLLIGKPEDRAAAADDIPMKTPCALPSRKACRAWRRSSAWPKIAESPSERFTEYLTFDGRRRHALRGGAATWRA